MRILFDQGVPVPLRRWFSEEVKTCYEMGWGELSNGKLLAVAEEQFDAFVTTDKNLKHQQHLRDLDLAVLVLPTTKRPVLRDHAEAIASAAEGAAAAGFIEWNLPA